MNGLYKYVFLLVLFFSESALSQLEKNLGVFESYEAADAANREFCASKLAESVGGGACGNFNDLWRVCRSCQVMASNYDKVNENEITISVRSFVPVQGDCSSQGMTPNAEGKCECKEPSTLEGGITNCNKECTADSPDYDFVTGQCGVPPEQKEPEQCKTGNPIVITTGEKVQVERADYQAGGALSLMFQRNYASQRAPEAEVNFYRHKVEGISARSYGGIIGSTVVSGGAITLPSAVSNNIDGLANPFTRMKWQGLLEDHAPAAGMKQWRHNYNYRLYIGDSRLQLRWVRPQGNLVSFSRSSTSENFTAANLAKFKVVETAGGDFEIHFANGLLHRYDSTGLLIRISQGAALYQTLGYDANRMLSTVTHSNGNAIQLTYFDDYYLSTVSFPGGKNITLTYDDQGNPVSITTQYTGDTGELMTLERLYHYDDPLHPYALTGITDENGERFVSWTYDQEGRAVSSTHAEGLADTVTVSFPDDLTTVTTNALGKETRYNYAIANGVKRLANVEGVATANCAAAFKNYTYYPNGKIETRTDWKGNITHYTYDSQGREITRTTAYGTPNARTVTTEWDVTHKWKAAKTTDAISETTYTYNADGKVLTHTVVDLVTTESRTTTYTYNAFGQISSVDGPRTDIADTVTYQYDTQGRFIGSQNAAGQSVAITAFDASDRPVSMMDNNGVITELAYNGQGLLASSTLVSPSGNSAENLASFYRYDNIGQLVQMTLPDDSSIFYEYDGARRLVATRNNLGERIELELDAAGNVTSESILDASANLRYQLERSYDELSRVLELRSGADTATVNYSYDVNNNPVATIDGRDYQSDQEYDELDRLKKIIDPLYNETAFAYDEKDRLTTVTDARGLQTHYQYDAFGNLLLLDSPDTGVTTYTYDGAGNRLSMLDNEGIIASYTYDNLNRLTSVSYPANPQENIVYSYDDTSNGNYGVGRLTGIVDQSGEHHYRYDFAGRLLEDSYLISGTSYVRTYRYNAAGQLERLTYPGGRELRYEYDAVGRVRNLYSKKTPQSLEQLILSGVDYLPFGPVDNFTYGNGIKQQYTYDDSYRLINTLASGAVAVMARDYTYDGNSNITEIDSLAENKNFVYDELNRISQASESTRQFSYEYDAVGNRTERSITESGAVKTETYSVDIASNRITQQDLDHSGNTSQRYFSYDPRGNLVGDTQSGGQQGEAVSIEYNDANRPVSATINGNVTHYIHNSLGQRTVKTGSSGTEHFHYTDNGQLLAVSDASGQINQEYIYLQDRLVAVVTNNGSPESDPEITMSYPPGDAELEQQIVYPFTAEARDENDGDISAQIQWQSSIDGNLGNGAVLQVSDLSVGEHTITASITNSAGNSSYTAVTINNSVFNHPPVITITEPAENQELTTAQTAFLVAMASDAEDGDLSNQTHWHSDIDGNLGTGVEVRTLLSEGSHILTASITDSLGKTDTQTININVVQSSDPDDLDNDGLDDAWEAQYFPEGNIEARDDDDGDGFSNFHEFLIGSNPSVNDSANQLDPNNKHSAVTLSNNNARAQGINGTVGHPVSASSPLLRGGKYYWEVVPLTEHVLLGIGGDVQSTVQNQYPGVSENSYGMRSHVTESLYYNASSNMATPLLLKPNDIAMVAFDPNEGKLWFGVNGVWDGSPVSGLNPAFSEITGTQYPLLSLFFGASAEIKFSQEEWSYPAPEGYGPSLNIDSDGDHLGDVWEFELFESLNLQSNDDPDGDGWTNFEESLLGSNPNDPGSPFSDDEDGDLLADLWEIQTFGSLSQNGLGDFDNDGFSNAHEFAIESNPKVNDSYNRLDPTNKHAYVSLSSEHAYAQGQNGSAGYPVSASYPMLRGKKYYWEVKPTTEHVLMGIGSDVNSTLVNQYPGVSEKSYGMRSHFSEQRFYNSADSVVSSMLVEPNDTAMLAFDPDTGSLWFGVNGVWQGDPANGTDPTFSQVRGIQYPLLSLFFGSSAEIVFRSDQWAYSAPLGFEASLNIDTDQDQMRDDWELQYFDTLSYLPENDFDLDGYSNFEESLLQTDPTNPVSPISNDEDNDGMDDLWEIDTFGSTVVTGDDDSDADGFTNAYEIQVGLDPIVVDNLNTLDPNNKSSNVSLSNGNLLAQSPHHNVGYPVSAKFPMLKGNKYYWEVAPLTEHVLLGIGSDVQSTQTNQYPGVSPGSYGMRSHNSEPGFYNSAVFNASTLLLQANDIAMLAYDPDAGKLWFGVNGSWQGDPVLATGETFSGITGDQFPLLSLFFGSSAEIRFDPNAWTYSPPTGFGASLHYDVDGDYMDDEWELNFFGNLNQAANGDYDLDGVSNKNEFEFGTNPTIEGE